MSFTHVETDASEYNLPEVGSVTTVLLEHVVDRKGHEYDYREVFVHDQSDNDPVLRDEFRRQGDVFEATLRLSPHIPGTYIENGAVAIPEANPAARWLYYDEHNEPTQMIEWAGRFPTAIALEPLQRLEEGGRWLKDGQLDERTLELFTYMVDGIGLRNRARVYCEQLLSYAERSRSEALEIISLGSGAAVPNIEATRQLEEKGVAAHWRFYDFDPQALMFARELVSESDFQYSTFDYGPMKENPDTGIEEPVGQNYLRAFGVENESVDIVDALGLWEYLKPDHAARFASKLYDKLKPGGSLIVSNMTPSRPQREFNQRAVGWPGLYLRNDTDLLDILVAAGIDTKQATITHSNDGVYIVMEVKKP